MSRALVVDDNADLAANVAELLETLGLEVTIAGDADAAMALATKSPPDLALIDLRLPRGASGVELIPTLRNLSPHLEIVIVTGNATVDSAAAAVREGVFAYVQKPFDPDDLLAIATRALEQARLRRESHRLAAELAQSEALHRSLVATVDAAIVLVDRDGVIRFANRFAAERSRLSPDRALEGQAFIAAFCTDETAGRVLRALEDTREGKSVSGVEIESRDAGVPNRSVRWSFSPIEGPLPGRCLVVGIDVTEMRELQRRAVETEAMAAVGALTTGLAHEIRNPLNAASLQLELLLRSARRVTDEGIRERIEERVGIVRGELGRLERMLNEFLSLARPRGLDLATVDLAKLVDEVVELQRPLAEQNSVELSTTVEPGAHRVRMDSARIKQVLLNLVTNAFDALRPQGGGHVRIDAADGPPGFVEVRVGDDGPGIGLAPNEVFRPFVTTKEGGTGLGLSIVRTIVEGHGGQVTLVPNEPKGALASFTLPRAG